jgi:hypothetical protein
VSVRCTSTLFCSSSLVSRLTMTETDHCACHLEKGQSCGRVSRRPFCQQASAYRIHVSDFALGPILPNSPPFLGDGDSFLGLGDPRRLARGRRDVPWSSSPIYSRKEAVGECQRLCALFKINP